ncbi:hypothetical protein ACFWPB_22880, partial [Rhodococcus sp. NPDC058514]
MELGSMKFRVAREDFADSVAWVARSLPSRPPVPVLGGVLISADEQGLTISGFDYEVSAQVRISGEVSVPGKSLVSGKLLADITRSRGAHPGGRYRPRPPAPKKRGRDTLSGTPRPVGVGTPRPP